MIYTVLFVINCIVICCTSSICRRMFVVEIKGRECRNTPKYWRYDGMRTVSWRENVGGGIAYARNCMGGGGQFVHTSYTTQVVCLDLDSLCHRLYK